MEREFEPCMHNHKMRKSTNRSLKSLNDQCKRRGVALREFMSIENGPAGRRRTMRKHMKCPLANIFCAAGRGRLQTHITRADGRGRHPI